MKETEKCNILPKAMPGQATKSGPQHDCEILVWQALVPRCPCLAGGGGVLEWGPGALLGSEWGGVPAGWLGQLHTPHLLLHGADRPGLPRLHRASSYLGRSCPNQQQLDRLGP